MLIRTTKKNLFFFLTFAFILGLILTLAVGQVKNLSSKQDIRSHAAEPEGVYAGRTNGTDTVNSPEQPILMYLIETLIKEKAPFQKIEDAIIKHDTGPEGVRTLYNEIREISPTGGTSK